MSNYTVVIRPDETGEGSNMIELAIPSQKREFLYFPSLPDAEEVEDETGDMEATLLYHMVEYIAHLERQLAIKTQRCRHLDVVIKQLEGTNFDIETMVAQAYRNLSPVDMDSQERLIARRCAETLKPLIHADAQTVQELKEKISATALALHAKGKEEIETL